MTPKINNDWEKKLEEIYDKAEAEDQVPFELEGLKSFIHSLLSSERQRLRERVKKFAEENKTDVPAAALLYGMKVKINPLVPNDEIWIGTEKSHTVINLSKVENKEDK